MRYVLLHACPQPPDDLPNQLVVCLIVKLRVERWFEAIQRLIPLANEVKSESIEQALLSANISVHSGNG